MGSVLYGPGYAHREASRAASPPREAYKPVASPTGTVMVHAWDRRPPAPPSMAVLDRAGREADAAGYVGNFHFHKPPDGGAGGTLEPSSIPPRRPDSLSGCTGQVYGGHGYGVSHLVKKQLPSPPCHDADGTAAVWAEPRTVRRRSSNNQPVGGRIMAAQMQAEAIARAREASPPRRRLASEQPVGGRILSAQIEAERAAKEEAHRRRVAQVSSWGQVCA